MGGYPDIHTIHETRRTGQTKAEIPCHDKRSGLSLMRMPGFLTLGLTQATEEALTLCPVATTKTVCNVSLQVDKTVLLHRLRPVPLHGTLDRLGSVSYHQQPPIFRTRYAPLPEAFQQSRHCLSALRGSRFKVEHLLASLTVDSKSDDQAVLASDEHAVDHDGKPGAFTQWTCT